MKQASSFSLSPTLWPVILATSLTLGACGGGGGTAVTSPSASRTETVVCPSGESKTGIGATQSAALDAATALCPAPTLVSISPANGDTSASPDTVATTGMVVTTSSNLQTPSASADLSLKTGTTVVPVTVTAASPRVLKIVPTAKLLYGQVYTYVFNLKDGLGKPLVVSGSFTTSALIQTPWWPPTFVPMGTKVYLNSATAPAGSVVNATYPGQTQSGLLPAACRVTGDDCWKEAVRNGTIKFVQTTARVPFIPTRPIAFGSYKTIDTIFFPGQNVVAHCSKPFYADDGSLVKTSEKVEEGACNLTREQIFHIGNSLGELLQQKNPQTGEILCAQKKFVLNANGVSGGWTETLVPCP